MRLSYLLIAGIIASPLTLLAQVMPSRVISGQREGGSLTFGLSDGEPISTFIEHTRALGLSDEQVATLMDIRRRLRRANAPFMQQMDSLRDVVGLPRETGGRMMQPDVEALQRFQRLSQPMVDSIRSNNQAAQAEARDVLVERQRVMLDSLVVAERDSSRGRGRRGRPPG
jgi:hypothetical protein